MDLNSLNSCCCYAKNDNFRLEFGEPQTSLFFCGGWKILSLIFVDPFLSFPTLSSLCQNYQSIAITMNITSIQNFRYELVRAKNGTAALLTDVKPCPRFISVSRALHHFPWSLWGTTAKFEVERQRIKQRLFFPQQNNLNTPTQPANLWLSNLREISVKRVYDLGLAGVYKPDWTAVAEPMVMMAVWERETKGWSFWSFSISSSFKFYPSKAGRATLNSARHLGFCSCPKHSGQSWQKELRMNKSTIWSTRIGKHSNSN